MLLRSISRSALLGAALAIVAAGCSDPIGDDDHFDEVVVGVEITDMVGTVIASYSTGVWTFATGDALHLHPGDDFDVRIYFVTLDGDRVQFPPSGAEFTMGIEVENPSIVVYSGHSDHGHFEALAVGETKVKIQLRHAGHTDFETNPGMPVEVVDDDH